MKQFQALVDTLGDLEDGAYYVKFQDENGRWYSYSLDADLLALLAEGIARGSPILDITSLKYDPESYSTAQLPERWNQMRVIRRV
jgi:hypothetical protein